MIDLDFVGYKLKEARKYRGLTLEQLGIISGVAGSRIGEIENGKRPQPTFDTIARIAEALGVSLDELAGRNGA